MQLSRNEEYLVHLVHMLMNNVDIIIAFIPLANQGKHKGTSSLFYFKHNHVRYKKSMLNA